jgi:hypothetical protein
MSGVLVVYVRGLTERPEVSASLLEKIREQEGLTAEDTWLYPKPVRPLTRGPLAGHALLLSESIQRYWERRGRPGRIILIDTASVVCWCVTPTCRPWDRSAGTPVRGPGTRAAS